MHVIEQDKSTLRQGNNMSLLQYYDEIEKKLTLLTNKAHMSHEPSTHRYGTIPHFLKCCSRPMQIQ